MKRGLSLFAVGLAMALILTGCARKEEGAVGEKTLKAGFVYVGPVGDYGWSHAHDQGRKYVEGKFPWLKTVYVESVTPGDAGRIIDRLVNEEQCDVVFTTSFDYMDETVKAAQRYPDTILMHCSGFKRAENLGTYFAELYQIYYLNGLMAGALTASGKVGYVGAYPIPEVVRHINAYALGVKAVNPDAEVHVRWIYSWYDPNKAREAAEALVAEGVDVLAFTEDSPAVIEVAQEYTEKGKPVYAFSHYSPMQRFGEDAVVSGQLVDWGIMYEKILKDIHDGTWKSEDLWWRAGEGAALLGGEFDEPINKKFVPRLKKIMMETADLGKISVYDLVMKRYEQMKTMEFEPFTGPIYDQNGELRIPEGVQATKDELLSMDYHVDNVVTPLPRD
ncbi:basic membrane lipoprotein [Spirochaeta thermophila DSM 6578]|uniref:Basic membrane lipoprotein n=1 Tax=Winmispira thermophila (strain ATCC 700085 / DSM 6578 / Z-1203) TaxID=869211 RepID=G0GDT6_WINT7|nr:BMP family ABC transporter substrate-binding protein [Spirochaeta thermophila]AEJ62216.1 basic membrane lipoprotein [Spirochaeta thermophila DSM 6578]